jgi:hypothetical protein
VNVTTGDVLHGMGLTTDIRRASVCPTSMGCQKVAHKSYGPKSKKFRRLMGGAFRVKEGEIYSA